MRRVALLTWSAGLSGLVSLANLNSLGSVVNGQYSALAGLSGAVATRGTIACVLQDACVESGTGLRVAAVTGALLQVRGWALAGHETRRAGPASCRRPRTSNPVLRHTSEL